MANKFINRKIIAIILSIFIWSNSANISNAALIVTDTKAYQQLIAQLNKLTTMIESINEVSKFAKDTVKAIGEFGRIVVPFTTLKNIGDQLKRDAKCLLPNLEDLMPSLELKGVNFSVCGGKNIYKEALFMNEENFNKLSTPEQNRIVREIQKFRQNILNDATMSGLSQSDIAQKNAKTHLNAAEELEALGNAAMDERTQAAIKIKGLALIAKGQAQANQLLASLLRVNSSIGIMLGGDVFSDIVKEKNKEIDK